MNRSQPELRRVQGWLQAVICDPQGVAAGIESDAAREHVDVGIDHLEEVVTRSQALSAGQRLAVYGRGYFARLLECFRAEYACLRHALGDELFEKFVIAYLHEHPPRSYTLHQLAADFPRYLAGSRPTADPVTGVREDWPDFLIDLAHLERAFVETYDGPGVEGRALLCGEQLRRLDDEQLAAVRVTTVPCLRLLPFRYPVPAYFRQLRRGQQPAVPQPADTYLAITRRDFRVQFYELHAATYRFLESLTQGCAVGAALEGAVPEAAGDASELVRSLKTQLTHWADTGFFLPLDTEGTDGLETGNP